jgi:hypothetical protein
MWVMSLNLLPLVVWYTMCEVHRDSFDDEWLDGVEHEDLSASASSTQPTESAVDIRNAFMSYFSQ